MGWIRKIVAWLCLLTFSVQAAPLFPDVPDAHWAKDAVAALAAKGLVEGYPDGTFKGDRAASRWEVAMIVARLLAKMEQAHATFATKAELEEIRKLTNALREELDALGVRVTNLEENVSRLDKRVTELERITFYGYFDARVSSHSFNNDGQHFSDPQDALLNFNQLVGTAAGAGSAIPAGAAAGNRFDPFALGTLTVNNMKTGRPLANGTGFTSLAGLGLNIKIAEERDSENKLLWALDGGAEFVAFSSQGDPLVDLYYGVSAPYLHNAFTAISTITGGGAGVQPTNHRPFTRMTLDHFWVQHKSETSKTYVRIGSLRNLDMDTLVYQKQYNPGAFGNKYLDSYGFQVKGDIDIDDDSTFKWEVMGTLLPDRNGGVGGAAYYNHALGGNAAYLFHDGAGKVQLNFLRAANDASGGAPRAVGLISAANNGIINWVNPNGFYFNQLGGPNNATAGIGSTGDIRPIPMAAGNDGITGVAGQANFGNIGPQDQTTYGLSADYNWGGKYEPRIRGEYAHSDYQPQKNSGYSVSGDAFRLSAGATFAEVVDVDLEYLAVDPTFDPFVLQIPRLGGILYNGFRFGPNFFNYRGDLYSLHDTEEFPHNREGFRGKLNWNFNDGDGNLLVKFGFLDQRRASLQDVRFSTGALGVAIPNSAVLGFSPGFVDPVFHGYSPFTFAPSGTNALATPLETPSGSVDSFSVTARHKWWFDEDETRGIQLRGHINHTQYDRGSSLRSRLPGPNGIRGESVNRVDLSYTGWELGVDYDVTKDFTLNGGYGQYRFSGHYDPFGVYSNYAVATGSTSFKNYDVIQDQPFIGFDYDISDKVNWGLEAIFISNKDKVSSSVFATPAFPANNLTFVNQNSTHPFSWDGIMVNSSLSVKF